MDGSVIIITYYGCNIISHFTCTAPVLEYDLMMSVPMHFVVKYIIVFWIFPSQSFYLL